MKVGDRVRFTGTFRRQWCREWRETHEGMWRFERLSGVLTVSMIGEESVHVVDDDGVEYVSLIRQLEAAP